MNVDDMPDVLKMSEDAKLMGPRDFSEVDIGIVLEDEEGFQGFIHGFAAQKNMFIDSFIIHPKLRGREKGSVGSLMLMEGMWDALKDGGVKRIHCSCRDDEVGRSLLRFYRKFGCIEEVPLCNVSFDLVESATQAKKDLEG